MIFLLYTEGEVDEPWGDVVIDGKIRMNNNFGMGIEKNVNVMRMNLISDYYNY